MTYVYSRELSTFRDHLLMVRSALGYETWAELADRLGVTPLTVNRWLKSPKVSCRIAYQLEEATGIKVPTHLLKGRNHPSPHGSSDCHCIHCFRLFQKPITKRENQ